MSSRAPTCWSKLPEKVWLQVLKNLPVKDVNNVHLVCKNLHQIANLHVNPKLNFNRKSPKNLEYLVQSSRIFEELEFGYDFEDYLSSPEKFEVLENFIGFTGPHMKELILSCVKLNLQVVQKLLNLLPNLEYLYLNGLRSGKDVAETIKLTPKSTKIERIMMTDCDAKFVRFIIKSLEKCAIKEADLSCFGKEVLKQFLKSQEKNLKKLTISSDYDIPNDLQDLRLEHFVLSNDPRNIPHLEFLKHQTDLETLRLRNCPISNEFVDLLSGLKILKTLELEGRTENSSRWDNLHKLRHLKKLEVSGDVSKNILDHLKFGVLEDLEELDASFEGASLESVRELKRTTPNLRKIYIYSASSDTINALLEALENLESMETWREPETWKIPSGKVYPKIKRFSIFSNFPEKSKPECLVSVFPNLEFLKIFTKSSSLATQSFFVELLSGLKRLKTLHIRINNETTLDRESTLRCFQEYGSHLDEVRVSFRLVSNWSGIYKELNKPYRLSN